MRGLWRWSVGLALGVFAGAASADDGPWRPSWTRPGDPPPAVVAAPESAPPAARLGRPVPLDASHSAAPSEVRAAAHTAAPEPPRRLVRAQSPDFPPPPPAPPPGGGFQAPPGGFQQPGPAVPPPPPPPPPAQQPVAAQNEDYLCGVTQKRRSNAGVFENIGGAFAGGDGRAAFQSDHAFCQIISPVTEPFLTEDPRALTEIKPVFIYGRSSNIDGNGSGAVAFFGAQARVAFTERFSLVLNKFGWTFLDPPGSLGGDDTNGFSEVWIGPKYTFIRNPDSGTLLAGGLTFQIPLGSSRVYQDTGTLSLAPYMSFAQNFWKTSYGSLNFMNTTGYAFRIDDTRSPYVYSNFHFSYDVGNQHRFYPLIELNLLHYTRNGGERDLSFEGKDLINFGSRGIAGRTLLSLAAGARYKFTENFQLGGAVEFDLLNRENDLTNWRATIDFIFRY